MRERIAISLLIGALACNSGASGDATSSATEPALAREVHTPVAGAPAVVEAQPPADEAAGDASPPEPFVIPTDTLLVEPSIPNPALRGRINAKIGVLPPIRGEAAALFDAVLAQIEVPDSLDFKQLHKQAWDDFLNYKFDLALDGFMLMSKVKPDEWRWPLAAARACAGRGEQEFAQVFLVASLLRGGEEARAKIHTHRNLREVIELPWFDQLLGAEEAALAKWEIRERKVLRIEDFAPGTAPYGISKVTAHQTAPRSTYSHEHRLDDFPVGRLSLSFDVTMTSDNGFGAIMLATCKLGDRYLQDDRDIIPDLFNERAGDELHIDVELMDEPWPVSETLDECELELLKWDLPDAKDPKLMRVGRWCWREGVVGEGACPGFQPPLREELHINTLSLQPKMYDYYGGLLIEFEPGRIPARDLDLLVNVVCEREGRLAIRETVELYLFRREESARPGRALRDVELISFYKGPPERCELEVGRDKEGYRRIGAGVFFCYEDGVTRTGPCEGLGERAG